MFGTLRRTALAVPLFVALTACTSGDDLTGPSADDALASSNCPASATSSLTLNRSTVSIVAGSRDSVLVRLVCPGQSSGILLFSVAGLPGKISTTIASDSPDAPVAYLVFKPDASTAAGTYVGTVRGPARSGATLTASFSIIVTASASSSGRRPATATP